MKRTKKAESSQPFFFPPEGNRTPSQEPESYVISITLRVATVIVYQILENFTSKKAEPRGNLLNITIRYRQTSQPLRIQFEFLEDQSHVFLVLDDVGEIDVFLVFAFFLSWTFFKSFDRK